MVHARKTYWPSQANPKLPDARICDWMPMSNELAAIVVLA
jgi:hypothetical protein